MGTKVSENGSEEEGAPGMEQRFLCRDFSAACDEDHSEAGSHPAAHRGTQCSRDPPADHGECACAAAGLLAGPVIVWGISAGAVWS